MVSKDELKNLRRDIKGARFEKLAANQDSKRIRQANRTTSIINHTQNIKERKQAKVGNISARRLNQKTRVDRGDALLAGSRAADSYDRTISEAGKTIRDPNTGKNIRVARLGF